MSDKIYLVEYNPEWPHWFQLESERVRTALGNLVVNIEHVGSTAIPGLAGKPIIDMLVFVHSLVRTKDKIPNLEALGYAFWEENPNKESFFFVRGLPPNGPRTHHIHITEPGKEPDDKVVFRDFLRANPEEANAYLQLKQKLALDLAEDREAYTEAKTQFVTAILAKAKAK